MREVAYLSLINTETLAIYYDTQLPSYLFRKLLIIAVWAVIMETSHTWACLNGSCSSSPAVISFTYSLFHSFPQLPIMYWKIFNGKSLLLPTFVLCSRWHHSVALEGHCYKIFVPTTHTDIRKRFFNVRCIPSWNSLPKHVVTAASLSCFKKLLAEEMGDALFDYVP